MSRYFSNRFTSLVPYTPGEQPKDQKYIKLNTNESPFPPSPKAIEMASVAAKTLQLYPDPECHRLTELLAKQWGVTEKEVLCTNGSDEILNFAFMAFCDQNTPAVFPDITYGFYSVFAEINSVPFRKVPLNEDFSIEPQDYFSAGGTVFIANPNAPTGLVLSRDQVEMILKNNPENVVVIDEAYVDFGAESCVPLIHRYDNLLVTQTFSKSRSMAGARLGFGIGCESLIRDLNAIKYSTNPYNINAMTMAAGIGCLMDPDYTKNNCQAIIKTRQKVAEDLFKLGFELTDSHTNFLFAKHKKISGDNLYQKLKEKGILVRHFCGERTSDYCRITIGSKTEMNVFLSTTKQILEEIQ